MPKAVFKFLWERIQAVHEVFAFVKNRCKMGSYYWVFTNVTPSFGMLGQVIGYYSVRRKPNLQALPAVMAIYREMLQIENRSPR